MNNGINAVIFYSALFLLVVWFYGPWKRMCIDWARQQVFESRNAIFDMARDGKLAFDSVEYREIRCGLEGLIRFTHRVSWPTLLLLGSSLHLFRVSKDGVRRPDEWTSTIEDEGTRALVQRHIFEAEKAVIYQMILRSIPLMVLASVVLLAASFSATITAIARQVARAILVSAISAAEQEDDAVMAQRRMVVRHSI